jgi:hypothetical protein
MKLRSLELSMFWMDRHHHHCLDFIIYVVVVMVMEEVMVKGMMVKTVVKMANECNFFYSEERNHWRFDCTGYCNNFTVVIEGCIGEMEINLHGGK